MADRLVNEEELDLHALFRWSPDGTRIAFWQFDLAGVGNFPLRYYLGKDRDITTPAAYPQPGPYPTCHERALPLAGTTNSAVRIGVDDAGRRKARVRWMQHAWRAARALCRQLQWLDARTVLSSS
jgi:dipeptidyl-peptidase-4